MVLNLEVVLPDGTTAWLKNGVTTPRSSVGPDLKFLIEGSEGMFGVVTKAVTENPSCSRVHLDARVQVLEL